MLEITCREGGCGAICREILAGLPDWFGLPEANAAYADLAEVSPTWVALEDGVPAGLMLSSGTVPTLWDPDSPALFLAKPLR